MGAKTGLLILADGEVPALLRQVGGPDVARTSALMESLYPGWQVDEADGSTLADDIYPPQGAAYAGSWPGLEIICDRRWMTGRPSALPDHVVAASAGRRLLLHAMHSVSDSLAFAVWEDTRLIRSLSISSASGISENIGDPLPFELPYWAGEHPTEGGRGPDEEPAPYPLPFHPLRFGVETLRALVGFTIEGRPEPDEIDADDVVLNGFLVRDLNRPDPAEEEARLRETLAAMGQPRRFNVAPDGSLAECGTP